MRALATAVPYRLACAAAGVKRSGWGKLLSLVTFFAAAKKVTAAPHRGNANKPTRIRDPAKAQKHKESLKIKNKASKSKTRP
ncbi:hypothetical protein [Caballeronia pedi]|uniref:hypothetical protein n=1 Tax=Caballeronia pedi TaxID=1777141 RepID=UPI000B3549A4|nr:hypothetical protein [Caballeronia pedi]